ncbi:hypothetical protein LP422_13215 [Janibacter limosus]|uniref:Uncharacterized protein n=1 Tax=Janibacter limosus TaxID=53458 RepID=A0AC61U188_9MICO|nr:hypothetical protein [Janibacter limosus]UUZ43762.1 hypothetical protein LP422_13215 [Janibacter limosus]
MSSSPRRRIGRDGILLAVMLCVPLLVLPGFRVAAAPSAPPPVEERPIQLISDTSTPRPTSTSPSPTTTSPTTTSPPKKSTTKTSTKKAPEHHRAEDDPTAARGAADHVDAHTDADPDLADQCAVVR